MTEPPPAPRPEDEAPMPTWVYAAGVVILILGVAFVVMHLAGGGIPVH